MTTYHIEYTLYGNPKHREVDWEASSSEESIKELIRNELEWFKILGSPIPRDAIRVFKVDGKEIDE